MLYMPYDIYGAMTYDMSQDPRPNNTVLKTIFYDLTDQFQLHKGFLIKKYIPLQIVLETARFVLEIFKLFNSTYFCIKRKCVILKYHT